VLNQKFLKTEKGREELTSRRYKLGMRHRQALILMDGATAPGEALVKLLGDESTAQRVVDELLADGFIELSGGAGSQAKPARPATPVERPPVVPPRPAVPVAPAAPVATATAAATGGVAIMEKPQVAAPVAAAPVLEEVHETEVGEEAASGTAAIDRVKVESARIIMIDTTDRCLGLMGKELKQRIAAAQDGAALRAIIPRWHMALRESRRGHDDAQRYLETVINALDG